MNILAPSPSYTPPDPPAGWFGLLTFLGGIALSGCAFFWALAALAGWLL